MGICDHFCAKPIGRFKVSWEIFFIIVVIFPPICPSMFRLVTINQLFRGVSGMLLSGYVGNWLDRHNRHFGKHFAYPYSRV